MFVTHSTIVLTVGDSQIKLQNYGNDINLYQSTLKVVRSFADRVIMCSSHVVVGRGHFCSSGYFKETGIYSDDTLIVWQ